MIDVGRDFERMRDYVVGRMSEEERRGFEDRLGRDPELVRELEQSLRLREGLRQLKAQGYFSRPPARTTVGARVLALRARDWLPALAAAAVTAVALFLWVQQPGVQARGILRASAGSSSAVQFNFMTMRSESVPDLRLPSQGAIELRVKPAAHASVSSFRVTLSRVGAAGTVTPIGALGGLRPDADDFIHSYAESTGLAPGRYRLLVEPEATGKAVGESFEFTLSRDPPSAR